MVFSACVNRFPAYLSVHSSKLSIHSGTIFGINSHSGGQTIYVLKYHFTSLVLKQFNFSLFTDSFYYLETFILVIRDFFLLPNCFTILKLLYDQRIKDILRVLSLYPRLLKIADISDVLTGNFTNLVNYYILTTKHCNLSLNIF